MRQLIAVLLIVGAPCFADPWGKDADLVAVKPCDQDRVQVSGAGSVAMRGLIHFHQQVISRSDGPRSHFRPSSSEYAKQAIIKYGALRGFAMGCDRLMRENSEPWVYPTIMWEDQQMKYDPVR